MLQNSVAVGLFSLLHIALASLAVSFMIIAPVFESLDRRHPFNLEIARSVTRFTLVTFTVSTVLAVLMIELFVGLFPLTNGWMFNQFRRPIYLAVAAFFLQLFSLYPYYHFWEPIRRKRRRLHLALGFLAALFILVWGTILDGMGSYMLTPPDGGGNGTNLLNPTWLPLVIHRLFGNFVFGGFAIAAYAGFMLGRKRDHPDEPYYLYMMKTGILIGLMALFIQPLTGLLYASQIREAAPEAYQQTIQGRYRGLVYLQFILIGLLFVGSHFLFRRARAERKRDLLGGGLFILTALLMIALAEVPAARRLFTFLLLAESLFSFLRERPAWNAAGSALLNQAGARRLAMALGAIALLTYWTMGTIRETARRPDTVRGMISLQDEARAPKFLTRRVDKDPATSDRGSASGAPKEKDKSKEGGG